MNCDEVTALLAAEVDGEVDRLRGHAIRRHLADCAACSARRDATLALQARLRAELPRHEAPPALVARVRAAADAAAALRGDAGAAPATPRWRWFGGGALTGALAASLVWLTTATLDAWPPGQDLDERVVALHTRATLAGRRIDVASSDRHTVKPWLSARLDYSPPVVDLAARGFALQGARIDRLDGRAVAVLVYRHRDHVIDVVVRADSRCAAAAPGRAVRGFNVAADCAAQMQWLAVSDLNSAELAGFLATLAHDAGAPG